ncbi:MAG: BamA/TamA family outer membrane protein [Gammaproteobacteria bacterium]
MAAALTGLAALWPGPADAAIEVEIAGIRGRLEKNVRSYLDLERFADREDLSDAAVRRLYQQAGPQAREALRPFGYYDATVRKSMEKVAGTWQVRLKIDPGIPLRWTGLDIEVSGEGSDNPRLKKAVAERNFEVGDVVRHQEYDRLRNAMARAARSSGYLEAEFTTRRLEVNPSAREARAILRLETGPRYRFGEVAVNQNVLRDAFANRLIFVEEGQPYDSRDLLDTQYALSDVGYYSSVVVEQGEADPETRTVPVTVRASKVPKQRIRLGVGYATDSRLRFLFGSDWRRINDRGHTATAEIRASQPQTEIALRYQIPVGDLLTERFAFRGGLVDEELGDLESRRVTLGADYLRSLGDWQRTLFGDFLQETTRNPGEDRFTEFLFVPGIGMERLKADDPITPVRGWRLRGELRGSHSALGAQSDFLRFHGLAHWVMPVGEDWDIFLRTEVGISGVEGFGNLPASQRFYAGGDQSVRGYGYQDLSPRDGDGNRIGGRHMVFGSIEFSRRITRLFSGAIFLDAGNAFNAWGDPVEVSAGLGVHVHTPVGRVRLEVARSITESRSPRLHISVRPGI